MDPAVQIIILEQGNRSLEDHTRDFMHLVPHTHYPEGPRESIADYIEWVLASCRSSWTVGIVEKDVSPTQDPELSQPSPRHAEYEPEPTADDKPEPRATEQRIATEPEPNTSDHVREPAKTTVKVECCVEQERAMESPAHCTTAGGELELNSGDLIDFFTEVLETNSGDLIDFSTDIPTCHDLPVGMEFPPTPPLLSVWSPLSPDSPSAHPQPTTCAVGSPRVCQLPSASGLEDPSSPPPASESRTPPRPSDPAAPPRLSTPSSPSSPIGPPAPPGSLVFPAPPWTLFLRLRLVTPSHRLCGPPPPSGTAFILCRSGSAADLWISAYASVARASGSALALQNLGVALDLRLSVSASGSSASCSASVGRPPGVVSPSSTMAPPSIGSTVGHHGCGLGLPLLLLLRVPPVSSLAPPTFVAPLDSVDSGFCPPSGVPSSAEASSPMDSDKMADDWLDHLSIKLPAKPTMDKSGESSDNPLGREPEGRILTKQEEELGIEEEQLQAPSLSDKQTEGEEERFMPEDISRSEMVFRPRRIFVLPTPHLLSRDHMDVCTTGRPEGRVDSLISGSWSLGEGASVEDGLPGGGQKMESRVMTGYSMEVMMEGGAKEVTGGGWSRRSQVRPGPQPRWSPTVEPMEGGAMVEERLTTPWGRPTEAEQVVVIPDDPEDPEGPGGAQGSGDRGGGGDPEVRGGAGATEDRGCARGREEGHRAGGTERRGAAGGVESRGEGGATTDQGGAGGTMEPGGAGGPTGDGGDEGAERRGGAAGSEGRGGVQDSEAGGEDEGSSSHDTDGDWQTCGEPTAQMVG
ncbi:Collagen alpha-5(VI) chain [Labeo rohita]|uniref:Collagen alpha-5(VI) chain n=1 Tax=Labeo rohita TaxID=84645 RepID=A0ABQ8LCV8_LABRO|nr:Collagen alpha-5(VI) chain [Labeo rohita]